MSALQLAISPLSWTNDDMSALGGDIALVTCLSEMALAGFTGTELGTKYPRDAASLLPLLAGHGLKLASGWCSGHLVQQDTEAEWRAIAPHVALLQAAGVRAMVYGEVSNTVHGNIQTPLSQRVRLDDGAMQAYGARLTALADRLQSETGMRLAFHHHVGTIIETQDDILRLMACTGNSVGLTFDTGHARFGGADPLALLQACAPRVAHVHLKDVRPPVIASTRAGNDSFLHAVLAGAFTVPGDGVIDFAAVLAYLQAVDYSGWLVVEAEQDPAKAHPLTYARMAHRNIGAYLGQLGYVETAGVWQA
jgi:inosose dehydratase